MNSNPSFEMSVTYGEGAVVEDIVVGGWKRGRGRKDGVIWKVGGRWMRAEGTIVVGSEKWNCSVERKD